jgi:catalase
MSTYVPVFVVWPVASRCRAGARKTSLPNDNPSPSPESPGGAADHWNHRADDDYYSQPGRLFRLMTAAQQKTLFENTARAMGDAPREVKLRHVGNCTKANPAYGQGGAAALGIPSSEVG